MRTRTINIHIAILSITLGLLLFAGCSRFLEVNPPITNTNGESVFREDASAIAVLTGIYTRMSAANVSDITGWLTNVFFTTGLTGDELELYDKTNEYYGKYYFNTISPGESTWANIYKMIFLANSAIEQLPKGPLLTPLVKNQMLGEAKFIRALCFFYLVNLYGDVPLPLTPDYKVNDLLPRTPTNTVYQQINADLMDAQTLLSANYVGKDGISQTSERVRPNKWVATALLARVYLYQKKYVEAEAQATAVINNSTLYDLVDLNSVFLMNNKEAIWQLQPVGIPADYTANTREGQLLKLFSKLAPDPVYLTENLVQSFDNKDRRKAEWIDTIMFGGKAYYFAYKYKIGRESAPTQEYSTVFRLGEQYLIRAEARIQQSNIIAGIADLNRIRLRATDVSAPKGEQLPPISTTLSQKDALLAVENERRWELFTEWGHRWLDLKRTGRIDAVLSSFKTNWQSTDQLFPLPGNDVVSNPNLKGHQNPGYN
jgi:hypothetical protein